MAGPRLLPREVIQNGFHFGAEAERYLILNALISWASWFDNFEIAFLFILSLICFSRGGAVFWSTVLNRLQAFVRLQHAF